MAKRFGFTLAEILITLGIIGIIASMTIPLLKKAATEMEYKAGILELVSLLNQAIMQNLAFDNTDFSGLTNGTGNDSIYSMFNARIKVIDKSDQPVGDLGYAFSATGNYTLYFKNGMAISFPQDAHNCTSGNYLTNHCTMVVDVNGKVKPNNLSTATSDVAYSINIGESAYAVAVSTATTATTTTTMSTTTTGTTSTGSTDTTSITNGTSISDQFVLDFYDRKVVAHNAAAKYVINGISK